MSCLPAAEVMKCGSMLPNGYWVWTRRKTIYAHRHVYEECFGLIPEGYQVHHTCGKRDCVNPMHITVITRADHIAMHRATHCREGHEMTDENTIRDPFPRCRICRTRRQKEYRSTPEFRDRRNARRRAQYALTHGAPTVGAQLRKALT